MTGPPGPFGILARMRPLMLLALLTLSAAGAPAPPAGQDGVTLARNPGLSAGVRAALRDLPPGVTYSVLVREPGGGRVLEAFQPDRSLIPASTMKLITGAAVLADRGGADGWWSTEVTVPAAQVGRAAVDTLTLRGSGDPTLTAAQGQYSLRALAAQVRARGVREVRAVHVDDAPLNAASWVGAEIGVPMTALRLAEWHDRPPGTADQARAWIGVALIAELRRAGVRVRSDRVASAAAYRPYVPPAVRDERGQLQPPDPAIPLARRPEQGIASVRSASPVGVLSATERPSDNLRAEELLATLARRPAGNGTLAGALARERAFLRRLGADLTGVTLVDGSGLGRGNRVTARALSQLLVTLYDLPYPRPGAPLQPAALYGARRNAFAELLPQAGTGEDRPGHDGRGGTLARRLVGSGLDVRAKTGTLPGVSALAGYVTGRSGRHLTFVILMNGPESTPLLTLRAVQDRAVQAIAAAH